MADHLHIETLAVHYIKSNFFRVVFVDGAIVGPTPSGLIHMEVYNSRQPIPQETALTVGPDGGIGKEDIDKRTGKTGIVREVETSLVIPIPVAREIVRVLQDNIKMYDQAVAEANLKANLKAPRP